MTDMTDMTGNTFTDGSHRFWCDGEIRAQVAGCNILKTYGAFWLAPYQGEPTARFDHYPTVDELEAAFRAMRVRIGVNPITGRWGRY